MSVIDGAWILFFINKRQYETYKQYTSMCGNDFGGSMPRGNALPKQNNTMLQKHNRTNRHKRNNQT